MTDTAPASTTLSLQFGLDRQFAWIEGASVRYAVAELSATGTRAVQTETPPLNLALAIDISGSMSGGKIAAARDTAAAVVQGLTARDRLTVVAFDNVAELLLDARPMDQAGRRAALTAIHQLEARGGTNLWEGWLRASEHVAVAMEAAPRASHRVLLLSDGQANDGITDARELATHAGELLARGIITSAVGIGDGYDEALLGGMAEAGGGRLHDAETTGEISEVVLGELLEGRAALLERTTLRIAVPANVRAEVVGAWAHTVLPGAIEVLVGTLLPDTPKTVVFRLHCPGGAEGAAILLGASANGALPDGSGMVDARPAEAELRLAHGHENTNQPRDIARSVAAFAAWQAAAMRRAVGLNREGDRRGAKYFLEREIRWIERYARDLPGAGPLMAELVLLLRRADEELDPRLRKEIFAASMMRSRSEADHRSASRMTLSERLRKDPR